MIRKLILGIALVASCLLIGGLTPSHSLAAASCKPVKNPYAGSIYEGIDLRKIKASHVNCKDARRVVKKAHRKGLKLAPPVSGVLRYKWHTWSVRGDLRGDTDHYSARRRGALVRWVF